MSAVKSSTPFRPNVEAVPFYDADGAQLPDAWVSIAQDLVDKGYARKNGTARWAISVTLLIPLSELPVEEIKAAEQAQRALTSASYATRYTYEEHLLLSGHYLHQFTGYNREPAHGRSGAEMLEPGSVCLMHQRDFLEVMMSVGGKFKYAPTFKGGK